MHHVMQHVRQALLSGVERGDVATVGDPLHSGATALAILLRPGGIVVAHAGDCRAVLGAAVTGNPAKVAAAHRHTPARSA